MSFESYVKYTANFSKLNALIPAKENQIKYITLLKEKYRKVFVNNEFCESYLWNIRTYKSLKEVFTAALMFEESLIAKESNCWTSFYYLSYYSLFHAMLACVYMLPNENIKNLSEITHSKLRNVFLSSFCNGKLAIIDAQICDDFSILKYQREYYSYHMPPNHFLYENKHHNIHENIFHNMVLKKHF